MKLIQLIAILALCSYRVSAETTVEMIKQRAESGDAVAQSLMGLMYTYGYKVPRDSNLSDEWYQRAADQGDSFAQDRVRLSSSSGKVKSSTRVTSSFSLLYMPEDELKKRIAEASSAEFSGNLDMDELILKRADYIGKVVELKFQATSVSTMIGENPYLYVHGRNFGGGSDHLALCGQEALEWAMDISKKGYGVMSSVYALVEGKGLIALGSRKKKGDGGYIYSW